MRRFIGTALALGLVAAISWQVSEAQSGGEGVAICTRAGADVRTPTANGSCPSGYTKRNVAEGPLFQRNVGQSLRVTFLVQDAAQFDRDYEIVAAAPDGSTQKQIAPANHNGNLGFFFYTDPLIGTYAFGIRVLNPMDDSGAEVPLQIIVDRFQGEAGNIIQHRLPLVNTAGPMPWTIPWIYTPEPTLEP